MFKQIKFYKFMSVMLCACLVIGAIGCGADDEKVTPVEDHNMLVESDDIHIEETNAVRRYMLASGAGWSIFLWDEVTWHLFDEEEKHILEGHTGFIYDIAFSPDGKTIASGSDDKTIRLWDVATTAEKHILEGHTEKVTGVAFSPDGKTIASGSYDKTIRLWDVDTATEKDVIGHMRPIYDVAFSPDGKIIAGGSHGFIWMWDVTTGKREHTIKHGDHRAFDSVAFSPDGHTLAYCGSGEGIDLMDMDTGIRRRLHKRRLWFFFTGHYDVAFSPDGQILASGNPGGLIDLWLIDTSVKNTIGTVGAADIRCVAFRPW